MLTLVKRLQKVKGRVQRAFRQNHRYLVGIATSWCNFFLGTNGSISRDDFDAYRTTILYLLLAVAGDKLTVNRDNYVNYVDFNGLLSPEHEKARTAPVFDPRRGQSRRIMTWLRRAF
jgi:hypothetical protein